MLYFYTKEMLSNWGHARMLNIVKIVKSKQGSIAQHMLSQVDMIGAKLNEYGVTNKVNRHTLVGQAWVQKHRIEGEISRLDLLVNTSLRPIKKIRQKVDHTIDDAIACLPAPIAKRAHKTHHHIKRLSGGC